tara:strand:- start:457 stop:1416 length:960 start_codon:yes stop_codon:yes gene_type:complete
MKKKTNIEKYLEILKCPKDDSDLILKTNKVSNEEIIDGSLISNKNKNIYKIENNIIRFVSNENYAKSFEYQFKEFKKVLLDKEAENMRDHTKNMFNNITNSENLEGKIVCEIGAGGGRFVNEALKQKPELVIVLDYSGAIDQLRINLKEKKNILLLQADALEIPLKDNKINFSYSIGVLHHTKSVEKGFEEMCRITKPSGKVCLSVYRKGYYCNFCVTLVRKFLNLFNDRLKFKIALNYAKIIHTYIPKKILNISLLRKIIPYVFLPNKEWSIYDTIDSITPVYQRCFSPEEVYNLFNKNKLIDIKPTNWGVSHIGKKQ